jgi:SAM-dependent methyltransferase
LNRCFDYNGAARFSGRADWYARARPSYPDAAIVHLLGNAKRVVDVGAGTGIATALLAARHPNVIAVEPNVDMASSGARTTPFVLARAEVLPFRDASADLLTSFNAFHWFQPDGFFAEAHRMLARGGRLALVWNDWNLRDPFTRDFVRLMRSRAGDFPPEDREAEVGPLYRTKLFGPIEYRAFPNTHRLDLEHLLLRLRSISYIPSEGAAWDEVARELTRLFEKYADADGFVTHHYTTPVFIAPRNDG